MKKAHTFNNLNNVWRNYYNEKLIAALKKFDLIQALSVEITFNNEKSTCLNGLYTINQEKLAALSNVNIAELHQQNLLQPIYTMITSLGQLYPLIERKNDRLSNTIPHKEVTT